MKSTQWFVYSLVVLGMGWVQGSLASSSSGSSSIPSRFLSHSVVLKARSPVPAKRRKTAAKSRKRKSKKSAKTLKSIPSRVASTTLVDTLIATSTHSIPEATPTPTTKRKRNRRKRKGKNGKGKDPKSSQRQDTSLDSPNEPTADHPETSHRGFSEPESDTMHPTDDPLPESGTDLSETPPKKKSKWGSFLSGVASTMATSALQNGVRFNMGGRSFGYHPTEGLHVNAGANANRLAGSDPLGQSDSAYGASSSGYRTSSYEEPDAYNSEEY